MNAKYGCPACGSQNLEVEGTAVAELFQDAAGEMSADGRTNFYWDEEAETVCKDCGDTGAARWCFDPDTGGDDE